MVRLLNLLLAVPADTSFHSWCDRIGIQTPLARLETTPRSVAGRGVFATDDIEEGDVAIVIPPQAVLFDKNAAFAYPKLSKRLERRKRRYYNRNKWWNRLLWRDKIDPECFDPSDFWQAELTSYIMACIEDGEHPWVDWISQWQRNDPFYRLLQEGYTWKDEDAIKAVVNELHAMNPDLPKTKLNAALDLRLRRSDGLQTLFGLDKSTAAMEGLLCSRAIDLDDGITAVIPMFDMINHSQDPNIALIFDGNNFELRALRPIIKDEELFLCYFGGKPLNEWDEDESVWSIIQWGIPVRKPKTSTQELTEALTETLL